MRRRQNKMSVFDLYHKEEEKKNLFSDHFLIKFLLPLGTVLIAAVTFLSVKGFLSDKWTIALIIVYFASLFLTLIRKPLSGFGNVIAEKYNNRRLAKHFFPLLKKSAIEFARMLDNRSDNFLRLLDELSRSNIITGIDMEHFSTLRLWFRSNENHLNVAQFKDFELIAWALSHIISQHHRFCINFHRRIEDNLGQGNVPDANAMRIRQDWNLRREVYNQFINEFRNTMKSINEMAGRTVGVDYYELLKTLE